MGWFDFLGRVGAVFSQVASAFSSLFIILFNELAAALQFLWDSLVAFAKFLGDLFRKVGGLFDTLWKKVVEPFIERMVRIIGDVVNAVQVIVKHIQAIVDKIRNIYYQYFDPWFIRALDLLSRLRAAILVFRLLGFNWAKKLDADLQKIQGVITQSIHDVVGTLNDVTSLLQVMVDPLLIIRKDFFAHTLFSSLSGLKRAVAYGNSRPLTPDEQNHVTSYHDAVFGPNGPARVQPDGTLLTAPAFAEVGARLNAEYAKEGLPAE